MFGIYLSCDNIAMSEHHKMSILLFKLRTIRYSSQNIVGYIFY